MSRRIRHLQCGCERFFADNFGESEVSEFDRQPLVSNEDILWLNISMDNASVMLDI